MADVPSGALAALSAYLLGAMPFGYLVGRLTAGIDIRQEGSGNIGATNVARVLGAGWGAFVLVMDALKGLLPTLLLPRLFFSTDHPGFQHVAVLCGVSTVIGHMFPVYLRFRGGKGVATALGVVAVLSPPSTGIAIATYGLVIFTTRIASVASMSGAVAFAVSHFLLTDDPFSSQAWSMALFSLLVPPLIILRHRANIGRILRREEPKFRFGRRKTAPVAPAAPEAAAEPRLVAESPRRAEGEPTKNGSTAVNGSTSGNGAARPSGGRMEMSPPRREKEAESSCEDSVG
jgi:glycerol-3-phosphate acyltransferase PlsY